MQSQERLMKGAGVLSWPVVHRRLPYTTRHRLKPAAETGLAQNGAGGGCQGPGGPAQQVGAVFGHSGHRRLGPAVLPVHRWGMWGGSHPRASGACPRMPTADPGHEERLGAGSGRGSGRWAISRGALAAAAAAAAAACGNRNLPPSLLQSMAASARSCMTVFRVCWRSRLARACTCASPGSRCGWAGTGASNTVPAACLGGRACLCYCSCPHQLQKRMVPQHVAAQPACTAADRQSCCCCPVITAAHSSLLPTVCCPFLPAACSRPTSWTSARGHAPSPPSPVPRVSTSASLMLYLSAMQVLIAKRCMPRGAALAVAAQHVRPVEHPAAGVQLCSERQSVSCCACCAVQICRW